MSLNEIVASMSTYPWDEKLPNPTFTEHAEMGRTDFASTKYFPPEVKRYITQHPASKLTYTSQFPIPYHVSFYCYQPEIPLEQLRQQMTRVIWWLYTIQTYAQRTCKDLELIIYLTPLEKKLSFGVSVGGESITRRHVLSASNANTGFSTRCDYGNTIVVYRQEEWFKVFVHESFHYFGLDFAYNQPSWVNTRLRHLFCVEQEILLFEAYTEFWAEMIVMILYARVHRTTFSQVVAKELQHSLQQAKKVLSCQQLTYSEVIAPSCGEGERPGSGGGGGGGGGRAYREATNVFAYYVIKTIFLYFHRDFVRWCEANNPNFLQFEESELPGLVAWLEEHYRHPALVAAMDGAESAGNGLRMTTINI